MMLDPCCYTCRDCGLDTCRDEAPSPCEDHRVCADCAPCVECSEDAAVDLDMLARREDVA